MDRIPLVEPDIVLVRNSELDQESCKQLIRFYKFYQERALLFFVKLRHLWHCLNPGEKYPGLCADINPITGEFRPLEQQCGWSWGDTRGLGTWCSFLISDSIPDKEFSLDLGCHGTINIRLKKEIQDYCEILYEKLLERLEHCGGILPFCVDIRTNRAVSSSTDVMLKENQPGYSNLFAIPGFFQYGFYKKDFRAVEIAWKIMENMVKAIESGTFKADHRIQPENFRTHGPRMIFIGAVVEVLKSILHYENMGITAYTHYKEPLVSSTLGFVEHLLDYYYRQNPTGFYEQLSAEGSPAVNPDGTITMDPGHATETAGFLAELVPFLSCMGAGKWDKQAILKAALDLHFLADNKGWSSRGVMFKNVDLISGRPLADSRLGDGRMISTAPWWNVRERSAAALRLYTLTRDPRCLETYRKAQNASYLHYPNKRIDGLMVQTVDPFTLEAMDIRPATGNLDPMHDARARQREIEYLEIILHSGK